MAPASLISIVTMIEESEKLKSSLEGKAEHLADTLVPYSLAGHRPDLAVHQKHNQGTFYPDGRLLLCPEACDADFGAVRDPRGQYATTLR